MPVPPRLRKAAARYERAALSPLDAREDEVEPPGAWEVDPPGLLEPEFETHMEFPLGVITRRSEREGGAGTVPVAAREELLPRTTYPGGLRCIGRLGRANLCARFLQSAGTFGCTRLLAYPRRGALAAVLTLLLLAFRGGGAMLPAAVGTPTCFRLTKRALPPK